VTRRRRAIALSSGGAGRSLENPNRTRGSDDQLAKTIDAAFEEREGVSPATKGPGREAVDAALDFLDSGNARVRTE
jgi:hypothetical protein